jgi:hypothetical protein
MEQTLNPADRPSRLSLMIHISVVSMLLAAFVSGVAVWYGETVNAEGAERSFPVHAWRTLHGILNPFLCIIFGYLLCTHIRYGWAMRGNWVSGLLMEVNFALLILTGIGLYYAPESWRSTAVSTHRLAGVVLPAILTFHWIAAQFWVKKRQKGV